MSGPTTAPNGALFFTQLEGYLVALHERGIVNENGLMEVLAELVDGQPLTIDSLIRIFGVKAIYGVLSGELATMPTPLALARIDAHRAAAITGFCLRPGLFTASEIVNRASAVVEELRAQGVL